MGLSICASKKKAWEERGPNPTNIILYTTFQACTFDLRVAYFLREFPYWRVVQSRSWRHATPCDVMWRHVTPCDAMQSGLALVPGALLLSQLVICFSVVQVFRCWFWFKFWCLKLILGHLSWDFVPKIFTWVGVGKGRPRPQGGCAPSQNQPTISLPIQIFIF